MTGSELVRRSSLPDKLQYAKLLADSGLLPVAYRRQPANVLYATEYGEMLGLAPLAAINGLHIIEGKPTASAGMVSALVRRAGHRLRSGYDTAKQVGWCEIVRHDDPDFTYRSEWTLERAVAASLCEVRNGRAYARDSKNRPTPWERYPEAMMKSRAITECARDACEEALNGVHYTPEELGANVDEHGEPIKVVASDRLDTPPVDWDAELRQAGTDLDALRALWDRAKAIDPDNDALAEQIKAAVAAAKEATASPAPADMATDDPLDAELVDEPRQVTTAQLTRIHATLGDFGMTDPVEKRVTLGMIVRHTLNSSKELTLDEAKFVIDELTRIGQSDDKATALSFYLANLDTDTPQA